MTRIGFAFLAVFALSGFAFAVQAPPVSPLEFGDVSTLPEANPLWLFLAGEGFWGAIVVGIAGFAYRFLRPYILAWMEERRFARLFLAAEACVAQNNAVYVEGMKAAHTDGKLTEDEANLVFQGCKENLVAFMRSQGVDIIKEYGDLFVEAIIELIVAQLKNPLAKAVAGPLSGSSVSAPLPPSV